jgi:glutathione S-transferase
MFYNSVGARTIEGERRMITIWGRNTSSNVQKVLWMCEELGLKFDRKDVGGSFGGLDTPQFVALNPNKSVPVIEDGGAIVWESHAILRFLAAKYGSDTIYPAKPEARALVEQWLDWHLSVLAPAMTPVFLGYFRTPAASRNETELARQLAHLTSAMILLDEQIAGRAFIAGDNLTIADVAFGNSVWRWFAFPVDRPKLPNLQAWQDRVAERPGHRLHIAQPVS